MLRRKPDTTNTTNVAANTTVAFSGCREDIAAGLVRRKSSDHLLRELCVAPKLHSLCHVYFGQT